MTGSLLGASKHNNNSNNGAQCAGGGLQLQCCWSFVCQPNHHRRCRHHHLIFSRGEDDKLSSKKRSERRWNQQIQASQSGENHQGGQSCGTQLVSQFDDISHANIRDTRETRKALFMGLVIGKIEDCIEDRN